MGVPALFRWLSKKYPKIILPVAEEEEVVVKDDEGSDVSIPVNIAGRNPNGEEFDSLYLDMNGIVHPCTHPEGKPAPETEEEMMVEVFNYTERVVNMVRPRKLLFMAIDGVAPRAKMNQQRSRRFRSSREAKEKEEARQESLLLWESMGKTVTDEERNKKSWDSNAITPGTPFMTLLANSLRYWVAQKLNTDPGWKQLEVIISDASVPGEGEHKIMDFIRRQRTNPKHDPNTKHVIYGLDADLIMLALATHEPHFRVLREDVFSQANSNACRICGQEGHYAAQCTGTPAEIKKPPPEKKPFIFLDVAILREYLEIELRTPNIPFPFDLERAIDDWVLLIFFVGNDFLPHLPSLEIREGAIDTLLKIWKDELPRMGGYVTNHGQLELAKAQIILDGLAKREDDIFRRRREAEERQDQNAKRRKIERDRDAAANGVKPSPAINLTAAPTAPAPILSVHPSLPARPVTNNFAAKADSIGLGGPKSAEALQNAPTAVQALAGSNRDVVANRRAIRMANMSAAEVLKAELPGLRPVKPSASNLKSAPTPVTQTPASEDFTPAIETPVIQDNGISTLNPEVLESATSIEYTMDLDTSNQQSSPHGTKRSIEEVDEDDDEGLGTDEDDAPSDPDKSTPYVLKVNPDGTVEQDDTVRLWEPGYKERYYRQKFGVEYSDEAFKKTVVTKYVEGMAWVLQYYYQGTPSWQWYYPYHFAPFAADFTDIYLLDLKFELGQPFKPFEQLMGVFPAASRIHIPEVFHSLMTDKDSPIIDFYPSTFEIDMNGKRMAWQGVALLPFIDQKRLLEAMAPLYPQISDDENRRNTWGNNFLCVFEEHPLYATMVALYGKRRSNDPVPIDAKVNNGIAGSLLPDPECLPGSTYYCPMETVGLPNIEHDRSLSAFYLFPEQASPHRSVLLPGVRRPKPVLTEEDREFARRGGRGRGGGYSGQDRGGRGSYGNNGRDYVNRGDWQRGQAQSNYSGNYGQRSYNNNSQLAYGSYQQSNYQQPSNYRGGYNSRPPTEQSYDNYGGYGGGGGYSGPSGRGAGPPRGGAPSRGGVQGYGGGGGYGTSYNQQYGQQSYGGYRGGSGGRGGYTNNGGGYGGNYGGQQSNYGGYGGGNSYNSTPRGGYGNGQSRGRGRGGGGRY